MRLIDAENFINNIKLYLDRNTVGEITSQTEINVGELASLIADEPTAYDVDKIVEELESDDRHTFDGCINKRKAIEIVKQGCIGKEV